MDELFETVDGRGATTRAAREPDRATLLEADRLCDAARYVTAHRLLAPYGPPERWLGAEALCLGARLARHAGAPRLCARLVLRAYRRHPRSPRARHWMGNLYLEERGPLAASSWSERRAPGSDAEASDVAAWAWLQAAILMAFRDFTRARDWLARAELAEPDQPYHAALRVAWLMYQDRYEEALAEARDGLARHPRERVLVQALAALLQLHGRFEEAVQVLLDPAEHMECGAIYAEAARLELELGHAASARDLLRRAEACWPLLEDGERARLAGMRSDIAYRLGDDGAAIAEARAAGTPFLLGLAERLERTPSGRRVRLDMPFVRQHHLTCVPATLATLARFWKQPADQLEIADRICYNGTPAHAERSWAEQNGWATREFTVSWEAARALLDRGIPFVVTTVSAVSAHAQAVIGYDERRATLYLRDPYLPATLEALADVFIREFAAHGPRGLALVPAARAELLEGLHFPDADRYDLLNSMEQALSVHERARAAEHARELGRVAPGHRLTLLAQRALAAYDANSFELQRVTEAALKLFPKEPMWLLTWLQALRRTSTPERVRQHLEELCREGGVHPVFQEMLAGELVQDARRSEQMKRTLRRVARALPDRAATVALLAHGTWRSGQFEAALSLYRLAACLEPTTEAWAEAYFRAALVRGEAAQALAFLEQRAASYQRRSAAPSLTLFSALEVLDRHEAAFAALDAALAQRGSDGELLSFAAEACARYGKLELAERHLAAAEPHCARGAWLRSAAAVASYAGDHTRALELWREVVQAEPLAADAHRALALKLAMVHGPRAAREHVLAAGARFPENTALLELGLEWLTSEDPKPLELALRRLIQLEPSNAWAQRELVLTLGKLGRLDEARETMTLALELDPHAVAGALVEARLYELEGNFDGARAAYRAALELSADVVDAIALLIESAEDHEQSLEALSYVEARVRAASISGDGVMAWHRAARRHLEPAVLGERLDALHEARPDLWAVWICRIDQRLDADRGADALALAEQLIERFPLLPGSWLELATVLGRLQHTERQLEALERAAAIAPGSVPAWLALADALERSGAEDHGMSALVRGLRHNPQSTRLLLERGDLAWRLGRREEALHCVRQAVEADATDAGAWQRLGQWERENEQVDVAGLVQQLLQKRPWDAQLWIRFAELQADSDPSRALEHVDRAIELDPLSVDAHDLRAVIAARLGHRALAEAACRPKQLGSPAPLRLRGRQAWIAAMFGDVAAAIAQMKQVVEDRPDYLWGFQQIADWAEAIADHPTALEAARALVRLEPSLAHAHGYLGRALADTGDKKGARRAFRRALELEPSYAYAAANYLELLLEAKELGRARRTVERLARYVAPNRAAWWRLQLAAAESHWTEAEAAATDLLRDPETPAALAEGARQLLCSLDRDATERLLARLLREPAVPAHVGAVWATTRIGQRRVPGVLALSKVRRCHPAAAVEATIAVFDALGDAARGLAALWLIAWLWRFVRGTDRIWGAAGYALTRADWRVLSVLWHWDYLRRQPSAWMLLNLSASLRALGFVRAAGSVSRHALGLTPDHTSPIHLTLLAFDAALLGQIEQARVLLADVDTGKLSDYYAAVRELTLCVVELAGAPEGERGPATEAAFVQLAKLFPRRFRGLFTLHALDWRRAARSIGKASRSASGLLRGYWDSVLVWPLLLLALLLLRALLASDADEWLPGWRCRSSSTGWCGF